MTRSFYPGAWYVDALPSGEFCVLFPNARIETHRGAIPLPPGETFGPLYLRCTNINGFRFAGQAHDTTNPAAWEWAGSWRWFAPPCTGVSPLIYDRLGLLHLSDGSIGSQGWRYCADDGTPEGRLVTGDATYTRAVAPGVLIHEYTEVGGLLIGQGHDGGVVVWDGGTLRLLEAGDGRFVRVNADGERVAVSFVKADGAVSILTTLSELRALPPVPNLGTTVPNPGTPVPPPPNPEPIPVSIPNQLSTVQRIRANYPTPLGASHPAFLIEVATATGAKLLRKDGGTHVTLPNGVNVSQDILMFSDQGVDILGDGEGAAIPAWGEKGQILGEYIDVRGLGSAPPPPVPPPPTPVVDLSAILDRLDAMDRRSLAAQAEIRDALLKVAESLDALRLQRSVPFTVKFPTYRGKLGYNLALEPDKA